MAVKERSQIKGTDAQIKAFAGHNGVLAFATDTKSLHVLSGTAGTTTEFLPSTKFAAVATSGNYGDLSGKPTTYEVGDIKLYAGSNVPDGWFRCDGSTIADMATNYPKLYAVLGTNVLPNYSGRYPLGATSGINSLVEGGLPNIEGTATDNAYVGNSSQFSSAFKSSTVRSEKTNILHNDKNNQWSKWGGLVFKASDSNAVYGKSTTVTPPSVKCSFLIRHD